MKRTVFLCLSLAVLAGCSAAFSPAKRGMYKMAVAAMKADERVPQNAVPKPIGEAKYYVAKNAASLDIPYDHSAADGKTQTDLYTVWFKRIAVRWEVDRSYPTPTYPPPPAGP